MAALMSSIAIASNPALHIDSVQTAAIVAIHHLHYSAAGKPILELSEWTVQGGDHCLILGPSGSGKTTLLHLLAGLLRPTAGSIKIAGQALDRLTPAELDVFRGRSMGIVFQSLHLIAALSVADNLRLAPYLAGLPRNDEWLFQVLNSLGLTDKVHTLPNRLSQGEAQRVAIARAVINQPALILADEPTSALDDRNCERVLNLLQDQAEACGATLIVATHDSRVKAHFKRRLELNDTGTNRLAPND